MISIIICSRTPSIPKGLADNIANTIGCEYNLVVIDNSRNDYSIFSAYNEGVKRSKGDVLCFMHDDIVFHTDNWGPKVIDDLRNEAIGCVGVIGSYIITNFGYWDMMHPYVTGKVDLMDCNAFYSAPNEVAVVDGMWFCIPKKLFARIKFDEFTFSNYHWYDMDICMQIIQQGKIVLVERNIQISHQCHPRYDQYFMKNMDLFVKKWQESLPVYKSIIPDEKIMLALNRNVRLFYEEKRHKLNCENCISMRVGRILLMPLHFIKGIIRKNK